MQGCLMFGSLTQKQCFYIRLVCSSKSSNTVILYVNPKKVLTFIPWRKPKQSNQAIFKWVGWMSDDVMFRLMSFISLFDEGSLKTLDKSLWTWCEWEVKGWCTACKSLLFNLTSAFILCQRGVDWVMTMTLNGNWSWKVKETIRCKETILLDSIFHIPY